MASFRKKLTANSEKNFRQMNGGQTNPISQDPYDHCWGRGVINYSNNNSNNNIKIKSIIRTMIVLFFNNYINSLFKF